MFYCYSILICIQNILLKIKIIMKQNEIINLVYFKNNDWILEIIFYNYNK